MTDQRKPKHCARCAELVEAIHGYRTALRPWLDAASGKKAGTVTYQQWNTAVDRLEAAIKQSEAPR